ncbi:hypothetical protein V8E55_006005 [Tylopilus felleus]
MSVQYNNFSWPSLYSPGKEVGFVGPPIRPGGYYLSEPDDIFKFTLYWTLIFHLPFNLIAGTYAFFNFFFPPARTVRDPIVLTQTQTEQPGPGPAPTDVWLKPPRLNARRSRWTFALLVLLTFLVVGLLSAVVGAAVLACVILGVYRAGGFYVSTWIPFIWAVIQSLVALLGIWPSVIDII